jgi:hypothetical protein
MNPLLSLRPRTAASRSVRALICGLAALGLPAFAEDPAPAKEEPATAETPAAPEEKPVEAAPGEYRNWFDVSVGGMAVDGNKAAAQHRFGLPASAYGGVGDLHYEADLSKTRLLKIDGHGLFDNEDYGVRLDLTESDKWYVRGGFNQYREYYDGSGGWFPANNQWFNLYDDRFELLRGSAFFEAGLRLPKLPEITVRYQHDYRDGTKDSTVWGDSALTGGNGVRAFLPTYSLIDETSDTFSLDLRHTIGKTTIGAGFTYEHDDIDNSRNIWRRPGETSDRHVTQKESVERDVYSARAFIETSFGDKVRLTTSYLFTALDTDLGGSRVVGAGYDPVYDPVYARRDSGFLNLVGGSQLDQHVWNVNMMWTPLPNLAVIPSVRVENQTLDGESSWVDTGAADIAREANHSRDMLDISEQLELRYTGVTNVVLYARGDWTQGDGNLLEAQTSPTTATSEIYRDSDFDRFTQKYTAGVHWYPLRRVNFHAQYYRKIRNDEYSRDEATYLNLYGEYPSFIRDHGFNTDDLNLRVTWRPLDKLTLVTRYDFQLTTTDMRGEGLAERQSAENTAHIIGETVTWTPLSRLYIQPGISYVMDTTTSPATSAALGISGSQVEEAQNDYLNVNCTVGFVLDEKTDLQAQYNYYLADNFNDVSLATQPYGAGTEEHGIFATVVRRITPKLRVTLRYGYYTSDSEMAGGYNDFDAHVISASARYLF